MKPTKSQKKPISDRKSSSSIQTYFKTAPKKPVACASTPSNVKSVYVHALLDKLKSFDDESTSNNDSQSGREYNEGSSTKQGATDTAKNKSIGSHQRQTSDLDDKNECGDCEKWRTKFKEMEKSYLKLSVCYTELMMKHKDLVQVSTGIVPPNTETEKSKEMEPEGLVTPGTVCSSNEAQVSPMLSTANAIFTDNEIKCLQCIPLDRKKDSTFILNCIQYAYKSDTASLTCKTLKGTRARYEIEDGELITVKPGKDPLTPEKVARIQQLFIDRVTKSKCLSGEFGERLKSTNFNQLIANAVKNVSNKLVPKEALSNKNSDLNL